MIPMRTACLLTLPFLLAGCSFLDQGDCTADFKMYHLEVRLPDGSPADSVRLTSTNERTGTTYGPCADPEQFGVGCGSDFEPGRYVVYTDGEAASSRGDDVTVQGERGDLAFEAGFRFAADECHVRKLSGPDTVTLR